MKKKNSPSIRALKQQQRENFALYDKLKDLLDYAKHWGFFGDVSPSYSLTNKTAEFILARDEKDNALQTLRDAGLIAPAHVKPHGGGRYFYEDDIGETYKGQYKHMVFCGADEKTDVLTVREKEDYWLFSFDTEKILHIRHMLKGGKVDDRTMRR